jgi:BioD-like phosphotransacetylase family protein
MPFLFIGSTGDRSGQSLLAWAVAERLKEKGLKVGFMKPFGTAPVSSNGLWGDPDVLLFKDVLGIQDPIERICPYPLGEDAFRLEKGQQIKEQLTPKARELLAGKDILLIMGSARIFFDDLSHPVNDVSLINDLGAKVVLIHRYRKNSTTLYSILSVTSMLKERLAGIVLNRIPQEGLESVREGVVSPLERNGAPIVAVLAEDSRLSLPTLLDIKKTFEGQVLRGEDSLNQPVGGMTVGAGDLTGDLRLFKRVYNKIVLLKPGDPSVPLEPTEARPIAGILLTGNREPGRQILEAAGNAGVPLVLVQQDTFEVMERVGHWRSPLTRNDENKVRLFIELLEGAGAFEKLFRSLAL